MELLRNNKMNKFVIPEKYLFGRILSYQLKQVIPIIDYAVEHNSDKYAFEQKYNQILHSFPNNYHAIKLSGIDLSSEIAKRIAHRCAYTNNKLLIDAEEVGIQKRIRTITDDLIESNHEHIFKTYQMYRKDTLHQLLLDIEYFKNNKQVLNIKLVRGAYYHQDKYTGLIYDTKEDTDKAYDYAIDVLKSHQQDVGEVIFATHNMKSFNKIKDLKNNNYYHASLMGLDEPFLFKGHIKKMVYIPFGPYHKTYPYLMRRLYENPFIFKTEFEKMLQRH